MKKLFFYASIIAIAGFTFVSCKSHEKCPAYSKVQTSVHNEIKNA